VRLTLVIYSLVAGGAERVMATMANHWAGKGWTIHLLTLDSKAPFYALDPRVQHRALGLAGVSKNPVQGVLNNFGRARKLRRAILETTPDAVISLMSETNVLTLLAMAGSNTPVLVQEQIDPHEQPIQLHWKLLRRWTYPLAARVVALNDRSLRYFPSRVRKRGRIIPNPAVVSGPPRPPLSCNGGPKKMMAMGRLDPQKGFDMLLRAFAGAADAYPEWSLEILGEGPLRAELEALVEELGLTGRASLPGTTKDPFEKLRKADLFAMSSRYEGFPLSLCEAMGCGLPAISFDCPTGPGEIIRHGVDGLLVPAGDVDAFGAAMELLMGDAARREGMAAKAPEVLTRFSLKRVMGLWEAAVAETR